MTVFEYFKNKYDAKHDYMTERINKEVEVDSFRFVEIAWEHFWGGTVEVDVHYNIIGTDDTQEMFAKGFLKKWDNNSWRARQENTTRHIALTKKGLKAFYKAMF